MSSHATSPRVSPKDLYPWASSELLDECSCLLATRAIREHKGDSCSYDHRAFARRHDEDIAVLPCTLGEPVCGEERVNEGILFFYFYQVGSRPSACACPSPGSRRNCCRRSMSLRPSYTPTAGPLSKPSTSSSGFWVVRPRLTSFFTSLR